MAVAVLVVVFYATLATDDTHLTLSHHSRTQCAMSEMTTPENIPLPGSDVTGEGSDEMAEKVAESESDLRPSSGPLLVNASGMNTVRWCWCGLLVVSVSCGRVEQLVRRWAPLVWLAPGERFYPDSVTRFLGHVTPRDMRMRASDVMPAGNSSESWRLVTNASVDSLLQNTSSFLYGSDPSHSDVPIYADVTHCGSSGFHVTYWLFYPYSEGKAVCTMDLGPFGKWPLPMIRGECHGQLTHYGSHVGDWEHMSLLFKANQSQPQMVYLSTHDSGAYYRRHTDGQRYVLLRQQARGIQQPSYPSSVQIATGGRLQVFAARGSHGLWPTAGRHSYVPVPRLVDVSGYGSPWRTWRALQIISPKIPEPDWLKFRGRWGNPQTKCHPLTRIGISLCEISEGPHGIPMRGHHFVCG